MCRVRKTCSIFPKEEKTGAGNRLGEMKFPILPGIPPLPPHRPPSLGGLRGLLRPTELRSFLTGDRGGMQGPLKGSPILSEMLPPTSDLELIGACEA